MSGESVELERRDAACRADLRELCAEFQFAISALTADDLEALKKSVDKQEQLAAKLQSLYQQAPLLRESLIPREALELIHVTRVYSALLQRSMRTSSLRAALCRRYKQHIAKQVDSTPSSGWSCEV